MGGATDAGPECTATGTRTCADPAKPICLDNLCVGCKDDVDCSDQQKPICSNAKTCVSCKDAIANACATHLATPVCATTGAMAGACVVCDSNMDCKGQTPICSTISTTLNTCIACGAAGGDTACMTANKMLPVCVTTGAQAGACVECGKDADCSTDPNKPFCSSTGTCVGCDKATVPNVCAARTTGKPACAPSGACVQCVMNVDCANTSPVCMAGNTCGPCSIDSDCGGRYGPTVCMPNDGRCATEAETIYVQASATCNDAPQTGGGTTMIPYCSLTPVPAVIGSARNLVVVKGSVTSALAASPAFGAGASQIWIVGQQSALIGGVTTGIHVTTGEMFVRDLTVSTTNSIGIQAESGATLHLQHVNVSSNMAGGILLDGAAFDITNSTVKNNGPGYMMGNAWGGIRIVNLPTSGPKQLQNVTVQGNNGSGLSCSAMVQGTGVLAVDNTNTPDQITPSCGFSSCGTASPACGAH